MRLTGILANLFGRKNKGTETCRNEIVIVSGLPRSGTSMMMRMLKAGGMPILMDGVREANEDNPKGYYEFERVKGLEHDKAWVKQARGKAVKVISALLEHLPQGYTYKVVFMERHLDEVLASQKRMLARQDKPTDSVDDEKMRALFEKHLTKSRRWLSQQPQMDVLYVSYNEAIEEPAQKSAAVNRFLGGNLDEKAMCEVIDPTLYRQKTESDFFCPESF
ncbi:MAG: sulfotransferase domain-containing protein [Anaerolineales bacterium]